MRESKPLPSRSDASWVCVKNAVILAPQSELTLAGTPGALTLLPLQGYLTGALSKAKRTPFCSRPFDEVRGALRCEK